MIQLTKEEVQTLTVVLGEKVAATCDRFGATFLLVVATEDGTGGEVSGTACNMPFASAGRTLTTIAQQLRKKVKEMKGRR